MAIRQLLTFISILSAASAGSLLVQHESRTTAPSGFVRQGPAPPNDTITIRVALAPKNIAGLQEKLMSISTPGTSDFRQWLSKDEVKAFTQPSRETVAAFGAFASANHLAPTILSRNGDWVSIALPVSKANTLFAAQFDVYTHPSIPGTITRTLSVSLPSELVGHVDVLHPTTEFTVPKAHLVPNVSGFDYGHGRGPPASCNSSVTGAVVTPRCLQDLYGIPTTPATEKGIQSSLLVYAKTPETGYTSHYTFSLLTLNNGTNIQGTSKDVVGIEANLDTQYTIGIATGVPVSFLSVGGNVSVFATSLLDTINFLDEMDHPPTVMTTSYGTLSRILEAAWRPKSAMVTWALPRGGYPCFLRPGMAAFAQSTIPSVFAMSTNSCNIPRLLSLRHGGGVDKRIWTRSRRQLHRRRIFAPVSRPAYQTAAVEGFLKTIPPDFPGTFNRSGRGSRMLRCRAATLRWRNQRIHADLRSIIALINDRLIAAGKPVMGFLNPFLYSNLTSKAFTDITIGRNPGLVCPSNSTAFEAAVGWDPLTGFGTPIFSKLLEAAMAC
ncbi:family S53 protease-like protein [Mycena leptocephala]|nr:family S53 protease-like protein [Mycena leptocephala]